MVNNFNCHRLNILPNRSIFAKFREYLNSIPKMRSPLYYSMSLLMYQLAQQTP